MGWFSKIVGGAAAVPVKEVFDGLDKLVTSDEERATLANARAALEAQPALMQAEITLSESKHRTMLVAGWRPAVGWVCAAGLGFVFVINPIIQWWTGQPGPVLPTESLFAVVTTLLGVAGLRTVEKIQGAAK